MPRKFTIEKFIEKAKIAHGNKYDYSKVEYVNRSVKVSIICPIHGEFWQSPHSHLNGRGCNLCANEKRRVSERYTNDIFIEKAKRVHGDKYDYSKVEYVNNATKVCIICPIHGDFWQKPSNHLFGQGCLECSKFKPLTNDTFIEKAKLVHGDKYDYSKVNYIDSRTKVCITCPIHGEFWQKPVIHLRNHGCQECGGSTTLTNHTFIEKAKLIHGEKYDYSKVDYVNAHTKICIICPVHGEFWQQPFLHLNGYSCAFCSESKLEKDLRLYFTEKNIIYEYEKKNKWLGLQSLDFYLPQHNIAIECQGIQHFKPIDFFGGKKTFDVTKERDINKKILCEKNHVKLLYYSELKEYDTFLGEPLIKNKEDLLKRIKNE